MALKKWDPFKDLLFLQERMSHIFDEALLRYKGCPGYTGGVWYPPVDIYETVDYIVLKAELPGIDIEDVSIEVSDNNLILKGERRLEKNPCEENYHRMERVYGSFHRMFSLPYAVDSKSIQAKFWNGVLNITVPKLKETKPGGIKVKVR